MVVLIGLAGCSTEDGDSEAILANPSFQTGLEVSPVNNDSFPEFLDWSRIVESNETYETIMALLEIAAESGERIRSQVDNQEELEDYIQWLQGEWSKQIESSAPTGKSADPIPISYQGEFFSIRTWVVNAD